MTTIKNFEGFKKSLLSATNGIMEFSLDDSTMFSGQEYESYRIYVCDSRYFNMFVIHNLSNNTYDVAFETTCTGISTMSRSIKTQKSLIERVVIWIHLNYLNSEIINADSEEYTDKCEKTLETAHTPTLDFEYRNLMYTDEYKAAHATPTQNDDHDRTKYLMETHSFPSTHRINLYGMFPTIPAMYNNKCFCCPADREGNRCCGEKWCKATWKRYEAIIKPEWHNVSLATIANIDIDMLDEKRQKYFKLYREMQKTISNAHKCKTIVTFDRSTASFRQKILKMYCNNEITAYLYQYFLLQLSMLNVEYGAYDSSMELATGLHESRRYNKIYCN